MIKNITILIFVLFLQTAFGQQKTRADRFFEKGDYLNATEYYELELQKKHTKKALANISTAYYNTFNYRKAAFYLKRFVNGKYAEKDKTYDNQYNFKLYQVLSALGDYETALDYYKIYKENASATLNKEEAIGVIEEFKLKSPDYSVFKVRFNSDAADFGAVKHEDHVYFASDRPTKDFLGKKYKWTHQPFLDLYKVRVDEKLDTIGDPQSLPKEINSNLHEGNFCFSADGKVLYVSKSNVVKGKKQFDDSKNNNIHLYKSIQEDGYWSSLEKLSFNTEGFSYQHPAISPDGTKLYFSSNRDGGVGSYDLYYVAVNVDGSYGEPVNLGETINTANREHFPFIAENGNLFFSSNGHLGLGMLDNFVSEKVDGTFAKPTNLGVPINSPYDDFNINYYDSKKGFFASNRNKRSDDIFAFNQTGEIFIREYNNIFEIRDSETKELVPNSVVVLLGKNKEELYSNTLGENASFNANLLEGSYTLKAENIAYRPNTMNVKVLEEQDQKHVLHLRKLPPPPPIEPVDPIEAIIVEKGIDKDLKETDPERFELLTDTEGPPVVEKNGKLYFELEPIYFDFDMWSIRKDSKIILDELATKLERYPNINLKISSHTDTRGTERYNQILSERRAESTRNYLALVGYINARRMTFEGFGESAPIIPCPMLQCTEEEHQLNRRSEFEIVEYKVNE